MKSRTQHRISRVRPVAVALSKTLTLAAFLLLATDATQSAPAQSGWFWQNPLPQGNELFAVAQPASNTLVAVGAVGTILRTTDGGETWARQFGGTSATYRAVSFVDANTGTAVGSRFGQGFILRTTDGGATWTPGTRGTSASLSSVSFVDANIGTAVGQTGTILRTTDGGATWTPQTSGTPVWLIGVSFVDANRGTVVGERGTILRTTTGGE